MIYLEDIVDCILSEEGQTLMGIDFITDTLRLSWNKIENIFVKCAKEYSRRKPIKVTEHFTDNPIIQLPNDTLGVVAVRYGFLEDYPRYFLNKYENINYEYIHENKTLKIFPPISPVKVTYIKELTLTKNKKITETYETVEGENCINYVLKSSFRNGTLSILKGDLTLTEISRENNTINLEGTLGRGSVDLTTRELNLELYNTNSGCIEIGYYPKYYCIEGLNNGDYVFYKLFASHLLEAIASLRAQATQQELQNIDLTVDDLYERVRLLKSEVRELLKTTIDYGNFARY